MEDGVATERQPVRRMSRAELADLALKVQDGKVFISSRPEIVRCAFMMIINLAPHLLPADVGAMWEYYDQATPGIGLNGVPMFMSARFVHIDDVEPLQELLDRASAAMKEAVREFAERERSGD